MKLGGRAGSENDTLLPMTMTCDRLKSWKQGNITPIFKKGKRTQVGNYRPVSLTSVCGKILEYFVRSSIVQHMTMNNLFCKDQHGFMEGCSCITQLLSVMEAWTEVLDNNLSIDTIYFDFQKAFDTVPHRRLLKKIECYGIKDNVLTWLLNIISKRPTTKSLS